LLNPPFNVKKAGLTKLAAQDEIDEPAPLVSAIGKNIKFQS
jgi:hypothetical protein